MSRTDKTEWDEPKPLTQSDNVPDGRANDRPDDIANGFPRMGFAEGMEPKGPRYSLEASGLGSYVSS